jgi:hypothetical protein
VVDNWVFWKILEPEWEAVSAYKCELWSSINCDLIYPVITVFQSYAGYRFSVTSSYLPVYCVLKCYILLLHHSLHLPFPILFGSSCSLSSFRRPGQ